MMIVRGVAKSAKVETPSKRAESDLLMKNETDDRPDFTGSTTPGFPYGASFSSGRQPHQNLFLATSLTVVIVFLSSGKSKE